MFYLAPEAEVKTQLLSSRTPTTTTTTSHKKEVFTDFASSWPGVQTRGLLAEEARRVTMSQCCMVGREREDVDGLCEFVCVFEGEFRGVFACVCMFVCV